MTEIPTLKAVVFDIDGTMIDTEQIQSEAFIEVLKRHGIQETELTQHGTVHIPGETTSDTWHRLKSFHDIPHDIDTLTDHKRRAAMDVLEGRLVPMPGVIDLIKDLQTKNIKLALASSAQKERIDRIVEGLELQDTFDVIVAANDVKNVKPAPDVYIKVAMMLDVKPEEIVILEDAEVGVQSALAAGMKVVAVPNDYTRNMDFSAANLTVSSLEEVNYEVLASLIKG